MECEASAVTRQDVVYIHHFGLERIERVQADVNQVVEQFVHVTAAMYHYIFSGSAYMTVHAFQTGIYKFFPDVISHNETFLLSPVVTKINGIDVIFKCLIYLCQVIVADGVQQLVNKLRIDNEVH